MMDSTLPATRAPRRLDDWTREDETAALAELRRAAESCGPKPVVLAYGRQSKSDFDRDGKPKGPSLDQQRESIERRPEFAGLRIEWFCDADKGGSEADRLRRGDYQALRQRIRDAAPGEIGAVAFYYDHRFNRNDVEHFQFMAEMEERRILVFDKEGLVFNADKVSWKIKAIVAQAERERIQRTVRDNLAYLKRHGYLLGVIPQGYMRVDGEIVEDPEAAPTIRLIFSLYATGRYSYQGLADHLNRQGIKPARGPKKENHRRPQAVIFTADVVKDILRNRAYLGLVRLTRWRRGPEEWAEGRHPALVDQETWDACERVRSRNRRCNSPVRRRRSYPLTPILRCADCGGTMHGESVSRNGQAYLYYACHQARRNRSAAYPAATTRCSAPWISASRIEEAIREELRRCLPDGAVDDVYRQVLEDVVTAPPDPRRTAEVAIRRLDEQLERAKRLYEYGEDTWETFEAKRAEIRAEQQRIREEAAARETGAGDLAWCRTQLIDLLAAWEAADAQQRSLLLGTIFGTIEASGSRRGHRLRLVGVPSTGWRPFFESVAAARETPVSR